MPRPDPTTGQQKWRRWTDDEWAVINHSLDNNIRARDLLPKLPGRSMTDIFNARNIAKRKKLNLCDGGCGQPKPEPDPTTGKRPRLCTACHTRIIDRLYEARANGLCTSCNQPLDGPNGPTPDASGTVCGACRERRKKYQGFPSTRSNAPKQVNKNRILPWPKAGSLYWMAEQLASVATEGQVHVIDLFGGTGHACLEVARRLPASAQPRYTWNDIHPGLHALMTSVMNGLSEAVWANLHTLRSRTPKDELDALYRLSLVAQDDIDIITRAALVLNAHLPAGPLDPAHFFSAAWNLRNVLLTPQSEVTNNDWEITLHALRHDCSANNHKTLIVADPPWPGLTETYEFGHTMLGRFEHLIRTLDALPNHCSWILSLGAERAALHALAKALPTSENDRSRAFWRRTVAFRREILITSKDLAQRPAPPGQPRSLIHIVPETLGLKCP